jgi:predicted nucleotidyltransferase
VSELENNLTIESIKNILYKTFSDEPIYKAILFGSYAKGTADEKSDIDLVIDSHGALLGLNFFGLLDKVKNSLGKEIDLIEISEIEKNSKIEQSIMMEGVIVYDRTQ